MSINSIYITDNFLLFSKQLYWLIKLIPHWKRLYGQITISFQILSKFYFIFVLLVRDMNTVFANQTPSSIKNQNTAHYHLIQIKWNQLWHVLELRRLIERFRNEKLLHELQNEWNLLYPLVISFDCGVFFWYDWWLSRSLLLQWVNV